MQTSSLGAVRHPEKKEGSTTLLATGAVHSFGALTAIVVDWNLPDQTIRCVRALLADGVPANRVVIVENGPTEPNWERTSTELSGCVLVRVERNVGFAAANNLGARILPGHAYLLVNNDAFVHGSGVAARMLAALAREDIGIVVPRLLNPDHTLQPSVAPFTVPHVALIRASGLSRFVPNRWQPRSSTHWDHASSREIEAAIGAVMLVDGRVWGQLGGLRESAFMYAEDLDLCWRARRTGWKTWFEADAEFIHLGGASSDRRWSTRERAEKVASAEAAMIRAHLPGVGAATTLLLMRLGLEVRVVCFTLLGKKDAAESCRGSLAGLRTAAAEPARTTQPPPAWEVIRPPG